MLSGIIQLFIKIKQTAVMKINFRIGECRLSFMRIVPFESRNNADGKVQSRSFILYRPYILNPLSMYNQNRITELFSFGLYFQQVRSRGNVRGIYRCF